MKILHQSNKPIILVITPLYTNHKISGETKITIKRNNVPYTWISYMSEHKHAMNVQKGLNSYRKYTGGVVPPYIFVLDRDIILGRKLLDKLYKTLSEADPSVGWCYCPFQYKGHINISFPPIEFDIRKLLVSNYISSNSLYRTSMVDRVGGFVVDEDVHRLSDWAMWLKCYKAGYVGKLCADTSFTAMSTKDDISAGSNEEYKRTKEIIIERFIKPIYQSSLI